MFRFEADEGQPEKENHKVIPTCRVFEKLGSHGLQDLMRRFLSRSDIKWVPFNDKSGMGAVYEVVKHPDVVISPATVTAKGITKKIVWVMTRQDLNELNGFVDDGNHRNTILEKEKHKR